MFKNYMKMALRQIERYKGYSIINIVGLVVGLTVCFLILLWVADEISYDRFHVHADRIYRVGVDFNLGSPIKLAQTMPRLKEALLQNYPEVEEVVRLSHMRTAAIKIGDRVFSEEEVGFADASVFDVFSFRLLHGDPKTALSVPNTVILDETTAEKYFGQEDAMGRIVNIDGLEYGVTGIAEDVPPNSHIRFHALRSFETLYMINRPAMEDWFHAQYLTYFLMTESGNAAALETKFSALVEQEVGTFLKSIGGSMAFFLQPLKRIHLYSTLLGDISGNNGTIPYVLIFSGISLFILSLACINFINLTTARATIRAREVGIRKTLGASRAKLSAQFIGESMLFSIVACILSILILFLLLPIFQNFLGHKLSTGVLRTPQILLGFLGLALVNGLAAGFYPAFFLASFQPGKVLKSGITERSSRSRLRQALVIFQFAVSIILIIGTFNIFRQMHYIQSKNLGFNKENVLLLTDAAPLLQSQSHESLREQILGIPGVLEVGASEPTVSMSLVKGVFRPEGYSEDQSVTMNWMQIDAHFIPLMKFEMTAGRNFSEELSAEADESMIINEAAARMLGWDEPLGKTFIFSSRTSGESTIRRVVGVVRDFHLRPLQITIEPLVILYSTEGYRILNVRIAPGNVPSIIDGLRSFWTKAVPNRPFTFRFLDESIDRQYEVERKLGTLTLLFSGLALLIGCLGLFGLASFMAERRNKEIGVRKVLGATIHGIVGLLAKDFLLLVALANLIGWPVAYLVSKKWLGQFAYRTSMGWWVFGIAGILALILTLLTVSMQALKAARRNPTDSLRYE